MGIGIYGPVGSLALGTFRVPRYVEHGGHVWSFSEGAVKPADRPGRDLFKPAARVDRTAEVAYNTHGVTRIVFRAGTSRGGGTFSGGQGGAGGFWAPAFSAVNVHLAAHGKGSFGVALYTRSD
jgi:hypothetical protein